MKFTNCFICIISSSFSTVELDAAQHIVRVQSVPPSLNLHPVQCRVLLVRIILVLSLNMFLTPSYSTVFYDRQKKMMEPASSTRGDWIDYDWIRFYLSVSGTDVCSVDCTNSIQ